MKLLIDAHCHVMTLARPAIGPFVDSLLNRGLETLYTQVAAPGYLLRTLLRHGGEELRNLLSVVENDAAGTFMLMEDDLSGLFSGPPSGHRQHGESRPRRAGLMDARGVDFLGERWDGWLACPLIMDFSRPPGAPAPVYYARFPRKTLEESVREMLAGVAAYRRERPEGRLVVRPFLGLDPALRGAAGVEEILHRYFRRWKRDRDAQLAAFRSSTRWKGDPARPPRLAFAGIKLYPPLGFDPWPDEPAERDAVRELYSFCERHGVPLTVHCDDQGYRTVPLELALRNTDPARWAAPLSGHPGLLVDFAHFGERWLPAPRGEAQDGWTRTIAGYMERYEGVYADLSFNGSDPAYWPRLERFLDSLSLPARSTALRRLMFGTDFFISLTRSRSYLDYVRDFGESALDRGFKRALVHENPSRFLFGE